MTRSKSRRTIELAYTVENRAAIAEIRKIARASGVSLKSIQADTRKVREEQDRWHNQLRAIGGVLAGLFVAEKFKQGALAIIEMTREIRGENDELVKSFDEAKRALQSVGASIGTVALGAIEASGALETMSDTTEQLSTDILSADTALGSFVRQGLTGVVLATQIAMQGLLRLAQAVIFVRDLYPTVVDEGESFLTEQAAGREDLVLAARIRNQERQLETLRGELTDPSLTRSETADILARQTEVQRALNELESERVSAAEISAALIEGANVDAEASLDSLWTNAQDLENYIEQIGVLGEQLRTGLEGDFTMDPAGDGGGAGREIEPGEGLFGFSLGDVRQWVNEALNIVNRQTRFYLEQHSVDTERAAGGAMGDVFGDVLLLGIFGARDKTEPEKQAEQLPTAIDDVMAAAQQSWTGGLGDMSTALGQFFTGAIDSAEDFGAAFKNTLGSITGSIGASFFQAATSVVSGASAGPWGLFLALGGAFSLLSGLLSGGGASGPSIATSGRSPAALTSPQPQMSGGGAGNTYILESGATFFTRGDTRREVAGLFDEAMTRGEVRSAGR